MKYLVRIFLAALLCGFVMLIWDFPSTEVAGRVTATAGVLYASSLLLYVTRKLAQKEREGQ